jgi:hypothetical protein
METPQYKVLVDTFAEPNHVKAGSIIRTWGPPGPHLEPMNPSAEKMMEDWYNEEHDEIDVKTGKATGQKWKPHLKYRVKSNFADPTDRHPVELVSGPTRDQPGSLSLAETLANSRTSTDQRPPPLQQFRQVSTAPIAAAVPPVEPAVQPTEAVKPDVPEPRMGDAPGTESAIPEMPPLDAPAETPEPSTSPVGNLQGEAQTPEPEATQVVFSAPPPSAKRIG